MVSNGCQNIFGQSKSTDNSSEIDQRRNDIIISSIGMINLLQERREPKNYESDLKLQGHETPLMIGSFLQETTADL